MFDGKVTLDVDYFSDKTKNLFFNQSLPGSSGSTIIQYNDGVLLNSGIEINTNISLVQTEDFSMSLNVNGSKLYNELVEMPTDYFTGEIKYLTGIVLQENHYMIFT